MSYQQDQDYEATEPNSATEDEALHPDVIIAEVIDTEPDQTVPDEATDLSPGVPMARHGTAEARAFATDDTQTADGAVEVPGAEDPGTESAGTVVADAVAAEPGQPFSSDELNHEWREIQASFVDDPHGAVQLAAEAADTALTALVTTLRERQSELGPAAGQDTEQLRAALQEYRKFCQGIEKVGRRLPQKAPAAR